jgi:hypothetical protein
MKNNINQNFISRWDNFGKEKEKEMKIDYNEHIIPINPDELHEIITKLEKMSDDCDNHESDVKKFICDSIIKLKYVLQRIKKSY